jgi:hypothetical protein
MSMPIKRKNCGSPTFIDPTYSDVAPLPENAKKIVSSLTTTDKALTAFDLRFHRDMSLY